MSNQVTLYDHIDKARPKFELILQEGDTGVDWEKESVFAYQAVTKNRFTIDVATNNPNSLKMAMINVASVGLTLNPALGYAYLVPRDGAICLDIGYQGLIKIATDTGSIKWAKAELVYQGDEFIYKGPAEKPEHNIPNPFASGRGKTIKDLEGVYCIAKTYDGEYLVEIMNADEIFKIRDEAKSMQSDKGKKSSPWAEGNYPGEMAKKSCIKRAQKTWPKTDRHERLQEAVSFMHETEGSDFSESKHRFKPGEKEEIITNMREALARGDAFGVLEVCQEYNALESHTDVEAEEAMKFWALFNSSERNSIHRILNDSAVSQDRLAMGKPELNQEIEGPEL